MPFRRITPLAELYRRVLSEPRPRPRGITQLRSVSSPTWPRYPTCTSMAGHARLHLHFSAASIFLDAGCPDRASSSCATRISGGCYTSNCVYSVGTNPSASREKLPANANVLNVFTMHGRQSLIARRPHGSTSPNYGSLAAGQKPRRWTLHFTWVPKTKSWY